jgi:hypothetical protein
VGGVANQQADQLGQRGVALLQRGRGANAAKKLGSGEYRHLRTAGCMRKAVLVPRIFFAPALRRGFFFGVPIVRAGGGRMSIGPPGVDELLATTLPVLGEAIGAVARSHCAGIKGQGRWQQSRSRRRIRSHRDHRPSRRDRSPASEIHGAAPGAGCARRGRAKIPSVETCGKIDLPQSTLGAMVGRGGRIRTCTLPVAYSPGPHTWSFD